MTQKAAMHPRRAADKLLNHRAAARLCHLARRRQECVVFTNGCFDLLHAGHVRSLEQARSLGDHLLVAVNADVSVRRLKGAGRPLVPARQRALILAALESVDWVVVFRADTPLSLITATRPHILAKGGDWPRDRIVGREEVAAWGGRVVRLREVPGLRTTRLVERIRRGGEATSSSREGGSSNGGRP